MERTYHSFFRTAHSEWDTEYFLSDQSIPKSSCCSALRGCMISLPSTAVKCGSGNLPSMKQSCGYCGYVRARRSRYTKERRARSGLQNDSEATRSGLHENNSVRQGHNTRIWLIPIKPPPSGFFLYVSDMHISAIFRVHTKQTVLYARLSRQHIDLLVITISQCVFPEHWLIHNSRFEPV